MISVDVDRQIYATFSITLCYWLIHAIHYSWGNYIILLFLQRCELIVLFHLEIAHADNCEKEHFSQFSVISKRKNLFCWMKHAFLNNKKSQENALLCLVEKIRCPRND